MKQKAQSQTHPTGSSASAFTEKEQSLLASAYFKSIRQTDDFYEIQSRCTGHCWVIQKPCVFDRYPIRIYHKHTKGTPYYHRHGQAYTVRSAIRQIKGHDAYQLNGRRTASPL